MVSSAVTTWARHTTGSIPKCGIAACAPFPVTVTVNSSTAAIIGPGVTPILPRSRSCQTWRPNAASGAGAASAPSLIIASAPPPTSSAGWKQNLTVPASASRSDTSRFATPSRIEVWQSCPHACILPGVPER